MSAHHVFVTPTIYIGKILSEILDVDHGQDAVLTYIGSGIQRTYQRRVEGAKRARARGSDLGKKTEQVFSAMVVPMYEAGVNLLAGSDWGAFNSYTYSGESLHG